MARITYNYPTHRIRFFTLKLLPVSAGKKGICMVGLFHEYGADDLKVDASLINSSTID